MFNFLYRSGFQKQVSFLLNTILLKIIILNLFDIIILQQSSKIHAKSNVFSEQPLMVALFSMVLQWQLFPHPSL